MKAALSGRLGSLRDGAELGGVFGSSNLNSDLAGGIAGLIGAKGTQIGKGGLGGLGGLGSKGRPLGATPKAKATVRHFGIQVHNAGSCDIKGNISTHRRFSRSRWCYQPALDKDQALKGNMRIKFKVYPDGKVAQVSTTADTIGDPMLTACVEQKVYDLGFQCPSGSRDGGDIDVSVMLIFYPEDPNAK